MEGLLTDPSKFIGKGATSHLFPKACAVVEKRGSDDNQMTCTLCGGWEAVELKAKADILGRGGMAEKSVLNQLTNIHSYNISQVLSVCYPV